MDLTINVEDYKLNIRAAGVIIHNGKVLVHKNGKTNHYALIGGRVEIGENSAETVKRINGYISTIENFFETKDSKYHEIMFIHKVEFVNEDDKKIEYELKNIEGKDYLKYVWLEIDKIDEYPLLPSAVKSILKENKFPVHKINNDLKK